MNIMILHNYAVFSTISKHSEALCYYVLLARLPNQLLFETREKGYCGHVRNLTDYDIFIIKSDSKLLTLYLTVLWVSRVLRWTV